MTDALVITDDPRPRVRRVAVNRPEKRNAMSNHVRVDRFDELRRGVKRAVAERDSPFGDGRGSRQL